MKSGFGLVALGVALFVGSYIVVSIALTVLGVGESAPAITLPVAVVIAILGVRKFRQKDASWTGKV